mgnify:CR=1 FL=1
MTFKELMVQDASSVMFDAEEFAETVTYNGASIRAIVELEQELAPGNTFTNEGESDRATIMVLAADVPEPVRGDTIKTSLKTWEVVRLLASDVAMHTLECIADERPGW